MRARLWLTPVLLLACAAAVVAWGQAGAEGRREALVLSGAYLADRAGEHIKLAATATFLAAAVALPVGVAVTRPPWVRLAGPATFAANVGQTAPTVAVLALAFTVTGIGFRTAVLALWVSSLLPVLRNSIAGLAGVDPDAIEAARGMGMSSSQVLRRVELPLAWPVILAGIRTAAVVNVATAALATFVGAGGLGEVIQAGIDNQRDRLLVVGATLTAVLALASDWLLGALSDRGGARRRPFQPRFGSQTPPAVVSDPNLSLSGRRSGPGNQSEGTTPALLAPQEAWRRRTSRRASP